MTHDPDLISISFRVPRATADSLRQISDFNHRSLAQQLSFILDQYLKSQAGPDLEHSSEAM